MVLLLQSIYIADIFCFALAVLASMQAFIVRLKAERDIVNTVPTMGWADLRKLAKANGINTYGLTAYAIKNLLIHKLA